MLRVYIYIYTHTACEFEQTVRAMQFMYFLLTPAEQKRTRITINICKKYGLELNKEQKTLKVQKQ